MQKREDRNVFMYTLQVSACARQGSTSSWWLYITDGLQVWLLMMLSLEGSAELVLTKKRSARPPRLSSTCSLIGRPGDPLWNGFHLLFVYPVKVHRLHACKLCGPPRCFTLTKSEGFQGDMLRHALASNLVATQSRPYEELHLTGLCEGRRTCQL